MKRKTILILTTITMCMMILSITVFFIIIGYMDTGSFIFPAYEFTFMLKITPPVGVFFYLIFLLINF